MYENKMSTVLGEENPGKDFLFKFYLFHFILFKVWLYRKWYNHKSVSKLTVDI
jgi:hypothetical protein